MTERTLGEQLADLLNQLADTIRDSGVTSIDEVIDMFANTGHKPAPDAMAYRWQYGLNGYDITDQMYAEEDADSAVAWAGAHNDMVILATEKNPNGWIVTSSDVFHAWSGPDAPETFSSFRQALNVIAALSDVKLTEAVCRCGADGECD
jgi:hypothetical protein